jgi:hypothetical protein
MLGSASFRGGSYSVSLLQAQLCFLFAAHLHLAPGGVRIDGDVHRIISRRIAQARDLARVGAVENLECVPHDRRFFRPIDPSASTRTTLCCGAEFAEAVRPRAEGRATHRIAGETPVPIGSKRVGDLVAAHALCRLRRLSLDGLSSFAITGLSPAGLAAVWAAS